jgi:hypothetical protein
VKATPLKKMSPDQLLEVVRKYRVALMMATSDKARRLAKLRGNAAIRQYHVTISTTRAS